MTMEPSGLSRLHYLATQLFEVNALGKEFLKLMKEQHNVWPGLPQPIEVTDQHGGAFGWLCFREGQIDLLRKIDFLIAQHKQKIDAELAGGAN